MFLLLRLSFLFLLLFLFTTGSGFWCCVLRRRPSHQKRCLRHYVASKGQSLRAAGCHLSTGFIPGNDRFNVGGYRRPRNHMGFGKLPIRLAIAISPSRDSSSTVPISPRCTSRTGSSVVSIIIECSTRLRILLRLRWIPWLRADPSPSSSASSDPSTIWTLDQKLQPLRLRSGLMRILQQGKQIVQVIISDCTYGGFPLEIGFLIFPRSPFCPVVMANSTRRFFINLLFAFADIFLTISSFTEDFAAAFSAVAVCFGMLSV